MFSCFVGLLLHTSIQTALFIWMDNCIFYCFHKRHRSSSRSRGGGINVLRKWSSKVFPLVAKETGWWKHGKMFVRLSWLNGPSTKKIEPLGGELYKDTGCLIRNSKTNLTASILLLDLDTYQKNALIFRVGNNFYSLAQDLQYISGLCSPESKPSTEYGDYTDVNRLVGTSHD